MRSSVANALALALALCACGKSDTKPSETKADVPVPPTVVQAPAPPARPAPADGGLVQHMREHFESIRAIERDIVSGDLPAAKGKATKLVTHQSTPEIESYTEELQAVRDAAAAIVASESHEDIAQGAAALASQCGHCHLLTNSITSFEWTEAPTGTETGAERMQRHRWAMDRLWEGLVGPSQQSWTAGAAVLSEGSVSAAGLSLGKMSEADAQTKLEALGELGRKASGATEQSDRAKIYGELLATCSACHATVQAGK